MSSKGDSRVAWLYPAFAIGTALLLLDAVLLAYDLNGLFVQQSRLAQAFSRIEHIDGMLYRLAQIEAEQRAHLMTGRPLADHDAAIDSLRGHQAALRQLYADEEEPRLSLTSVLVDSAISMMAAPSTLFEQGERERALEMAQTDSAYALLPPIRSTFSTLREQEKARVQAVLARKGVLRERVVVTFAITTIVALGLVALLYLFVGRDLRQRERIERALRKHRAELEERVQTRTRELTEANRSLTSSIEELARSNRELEEFAYVASHDLQEPLRKLRVFSGLLLEQEAEHLSDEGRHFLGRLHHAAERMSNLINDLLMYSRVRSRQEPFSTVDLGALVREVLGELEETVQESGATVEVGTLPTIEGDEAQLRQLLYNLIGNALKFRRSDVPCTIRVEADTVEVDGAPHYRLFVRDNGIGFDARYADRIFKPFQRLHAPSEYPGTGIGLAICRRIAERHGGLLTAESTPGNGASFCLIFPATMVSQKRPKAAEMH